MDAFKKVSRLGRVRLWGTQTAHLFVNIEWDGKRLSITGVEGPKANGNARGSCGQIIMSEWDLVEYASGWDAETVTKFRDIWERWHLNDMKAGSPAQMAHLEALPKWTYGEGGFKSHYEWALAQLSEAGLQPDPNYEHNGKPYSYGSAWLKEEVPTDVVAWLKALPDADIQPAWV
jgi:hypothetical protein